MNNFSAPNALQKALRHPGIGGADGAFMDDGRVMLSAAQGWYFDFGDPEDPLLARSVGNGSELRQAMRGLRKL